MASKYGQIIFKPECTKFDIHKPRIKNILTSCLASKSRKNISQSATAFQSIIKKNYGIMSGPFTSTYLRQYSTDKLKLNANSDGIEAVAFTKENVITDKTYIIKSRKIGRRSRIFCNLISLVNETNLNKSSSTINNTLRNQNVSSRSYHIYKPTDILKNSLHQVMCTELRSNALTIYKSPENKVSTCFKYYHDWKHQDVTEYRLSATANPYVSSKEGNASKRLPIYAIYTLYGLCFAYGVKAHGTQYIMYLAASAEVLALAKVEINLSDIPEGVSMTFKWRGKPLFIRHRTQEQIQDARNTDISVLVDPQKDEDRVKLPEWLVVVGVCTHLGCVPLANVGDFPGGYYCPCHGSHFDVSGRARKGPAPLNLEVPEYSFDGDIITVG